MLGRDGGALAQMLPPFEIGVGGPFGSGSQRLPRIHLYDLVRVIARALADDRYQGPVNAVAPEQATSHSFARALGLALGRPAILPLPSLALKAIFGQAATVLLASQHVAPGVLGRLQFPFEYPTLNAALEDVVRGAPVTIAAARTRPAGAETARYELRTRTVVDAPVDETFAFFSKAENLGLVSRPLGMRFRILGGDSSDDTRREDRLSAACRSMAGPVAHAHRALGAWCAGCVDCQEAGPYRLWWHEHTFQTHGERPVMEDRV